MLTYFTPGHSLFHFHISPRDFGRSLYFELLFQPEGLAFADHFFHSDYIKTYMLSPPNGQPWLRFALEQGYVVPYVRDTFTSFTGYLVAQEEHGSKGIPSDAERLAESLDGIRIKRLETIDPARQFGEMFQDRLEQNMRKVLLIDADNELRQFWEHDTMKKIRQECVPWAIEETVKRRGRGLRVAMLIEGCRRYVLSGNPDKETSSYSVQHLLRECEDNTQRQTMHRFFKNVCDTFNLSMAQAIECNETATKFDEDFANFQFDREWIEDTFPLGLQFVVSLPTFESMTCQDPRFITDMRTSKEGQRYFSAHRRWLYDTSYDTAKELSEAIYTYSKTLCRDLHDNQQMEGTGTVVYEEVKKHAGKAVENGFLLFGGLLAGGMPAERATLWGLGGSAFSMMWNCARTLPRRIYNEDAGVIQMNYQGDISFIG